MISLNARHIVSFKYRNNVVGSALIHLVAGQQPPNDQSGNYPLRTVLETGCIPNSESPALLATALLATALLATAQTRLRQTRHVFWRKAASIPMKRAQENKSRLLRYVRLYITMIFTKTNWT